jgi:rubrerythrin
MDPKEALKVSIDYEHKVRDHYAKGIATIEDPRGKKVFETLAREEQGHVDYLESRLAAWSATGKMETFDLRSVVPPKVDWIAASRRRIARGPSKKVASKTELELLRTALELERRTSAFYRDLVETLALEHRGLFARFLEIEAGHVDLVQAELDSLNGIGTWFDILEISLEAG